MDEQEISIDELVINCDSSLGLKVCLTVPSGTIIGVISYINQKSCKLVLEKVFVTKSSRKHLGVMIFNFEMIQKISLMELDKEAHRRLLQDSDAPGQNQGITRTVVPISELPINNDDDDDDYDGSSWPIIMTTENTDEGETMNCTTQNDGGDLLNTPSPRASCCGGSSNNCYIIDKLGEEFDQVIAEIKRERSISLSLEGPKLGRRGTLSFLNIATSRNLFFFDVVQLGPDVLTAKGVLGEIIATPKMEKIVHDCRSYEDMFHHRYGVNLQNVFDTQVAEIFLHMSPNNGMKVPIIVKNLNSLLRRYLHFRVEHLGFEQLGSEYIENNGINNWMERPLPEPLVNWMKWKVMFLSELKTAMLQLMLIDYHQVTQISLASLRDKDSSSVDQVNLDIVSPDIQCLAAAK